MKEGSGSDFQHKSTQKNKKTDILDLDKYRAKKLEAQNNSTEIVESDKKQKSAPFFESKVIRMDLHKKRYQTPDKEEINDEEPTKIVLEAKETEIIALDEYRQKKLKRKWKKDIFLNTAQVAGMTFLFLFMLMNLIPSLKNTDSKMAVLKTPDSINKSLKGSATRGLATADWFQAPPNRGILIKRKNNRTPDSLSPNNSCSPSSTKGCLIKTF